MAGVADETKLKSLFDNGGLDAVTQEIQLDLAKAENMTLQIAVTGFSGTGKSSFINALRGIADGAEGAAPTGVKETTKMPTVYPYLNKATVKIWDLPGIGTPNFQASEYLERVKFDQYDFFIILSASRFTENDVFLANEIQKKKKKFYFIRSKIDQDLSGEKHREKSQYNEKKTLEIIENNCVENLKEVGIKSPQVFLICSWELEKFDFEKLKEVLEEDLPDLKRRVFLLSLPNITSSIIETKKEVLLSDIWKPALLSALVAAVPFSDLVFHYNASLLVSKLSSCRTDFGLDDDSLERLAKREGKMTEELRSEVKSTFGKEVSENVVVKELRKIAGPSSMLGRFLEFLPLVGSVAAARNSYITANALLEKAVQEMAEDSKRVLAKAFQVMD